MDLVSFSHRKTVLATTFLIASYLIARKVYRKCYKKRSKLADLEGDFDATGSDVVSLLRSEVPPRKIIVVTGATSGIGKQTALLLGQDHHVIASFRNPSGVLKLKQQIKEQGGTCDAFFLDLSSLASVQDFCQKVIRCLGNDRKIDVLIHNAGVYGVKGASSDGYQLTWQVNAMAPALMTQLLLPHLQPTTGRVIYVSSEMHRLCFAKSIVNKCPPSSLGGASSYDYALSKACQILQAHHHLGVTAVAVEPGLVQTDIGRHMSPFWNKLQYLLLGPFFLRTVNQGCATILYCALCPTLATNCCYYANCAVKQPKANCTSLEEARALQRLYETIRKERGVL